MVLFDIAPVPYPVSESTGGIWWIVAGVVVVAAIAFVLVLRARKK